MDEFHALLACPNCRTTLRFDTEGCKCLSCECDFPHVSGLPWLFPEPAASLQHWRNRWQAALADIEHQCVQLTQAIQQTSSNTTRARLEHVRNGKQEHLTLLEQLLAPLGLGPVVAKETYLALRTRLPTQLGLTSYETNIHRDWCWGAAEIELAKAVLLELLPAKPDNLLILGAGAGRLAWELHQALTPACSIAMDVNPMLGLVAEKMFSGETLALYEFPLAPKSIEASAVKQILSAPTVSVPGLHFVLGDALRLPFSPQQFDCVVTPWFIDVSGLPLAQLLAQINRLLKPGGVWLNQGSLQFSDADLSAQLTVQEVDELAQQYGFGPLTIHEAVHAYMCSPASRHGRSESVVSWQAHKVAELPDATTPDRPAQRLPDWLVVGDVSVPICSSFQTQIHTTRIHAFIMSLIDGKRSLQDMAGVLDEQRLMPKADAEAAIRGFLLKMHEEAQSGSGL